MSKDEIIGKIFGECQWCKEKVDLNVSWQGDKFILCGRCPKCTYRGPLTDEQEIEYNNNEQIKLEQEKKDYEEELMRKLAVEKQFNSIKPKMNLVPKFTMQLSQNKINNNENKRQTQKTVRKNDEQSSYINNDDNSYRSSSMSLYDNNSTDTDNTSSDSNDYGGGDSGSGGCDGDY